MRTTDFRRFLQGAALVTTVAAAGVVPNTAIAQGTADAGAPVTGQTTQMNDMDTDDDTDLGWLGLLGLAGLLGLRRRDRVDHTDTTRTSSRGM